MVPLPVKPERAPPVAVTSPAAKVVDASLSVNVMVAVSPLLSEALLLKIVTVGATVSIEMAGERLPAIFPLPAASLNALAATEIVPLAVDVGVGVNVAV